MNFSDGQADVRTASSALDDCLRRARSREREVAALLEASRAILSFQRFEESARVIFDTCKDLLGATAGYVALLSEDGHENEVLFLDAGGEPCTVDPALPMPIRGLRAESYHHNKAFYDNDFTGSEWMKFMPDGHVALSNVMFAPMIIDGKAVGLLGLSNKDGDFTDNDAQLATAFGEMAAVALLNSRRLEELETRNDELKRFNTAMLDREMRIIELKKEVNGLMANQGRSRPYPLAEDEGGSPLEG